MSPSQQSPKSSPPDGSPSDAVAEAPKLACIFIGAILEADKSSFVISNINARFIVANHPFSHGDAIRVTITKVQPDETR
jgi:hypothetical protein